MINLTIRKSEIYSFMPLLAVIVLFGSITLTPSIVNAASLKFSSPDPQKSPFHIEVQTVGGVGEGGGSNASGVNMFLPDGSQEPPLSIMAPDHLQQVAQEVEDNWITGFQLMLKENTTVAQQQTQILGGFKDAETQIRTQRLLNKMLTEAHKDYQPSEQMCSFGSYIRSTAESENKGRWKKRALNAHFLERLTNTEDGLTSEGPSSDEPSRLDQFITTFCDPADNNGSLSVMCAHAGGVGAVDPTDMNADINYPLTVHGRNWIGGNYVDGALTPDERRIYALSKNLYFPTVFEDADHQLLPQRNNYQAYQSARSHLAIRAMAYNTFATQVGLRSYGSEDLAGDSGQAYMKATLVNMGYDPGHAENTMGGLPSSYNSLMNFKTKTMVQDPNFYTNLYDKPANVERMSASLDAYGLMQKRDMYDVQLRREMLFSLLVEVAIKAEMENAQTGLINTGTE